MRPHSLFLLVFLVLMLAGCFPPGSPQPGDLQTLHRSSLRQLVLNAHKLVAIFPDGNHALFADSIFEIRRLFLVDLAGGTVESIPVEKQTFNRFVVTEDGIIVLLSGVPQSSFHLWVSSSGEVRKLEYLDLVIPYPNDYQRVTEDAVKMERLLVEGALDGLTELQVTELAGEAPRTILEGFYNDRYFININPTNSRDLTTLRDHADHRYVRDDTVLTEPRYPGLSFDISRSAQDDDGLGETRQIQRLTIQNGITSYSYEFEPLEPFYYTSVIGDRLYLLGNGVKFIELAPLVDAGAAGR